jgi:hypothetical protein
LPQPLAEQRGDSEEPGAFLTTETQRHREAPGTRNKEHGIEN